MVVRKIIFLCLCIMPAIASAEIFYSQTQVNATRETPAQEWIIELLSYPTKAQAEAFIGRLKNKGFLAEVTPVRLAGNVRYQVRISDFLSLAEAKAYRSSLREKTNILDQHIRIIGSQHAAESKGWTINLISFADKKEATDFINRLQNKGFDADMVPLLISNTSIYLTRISALASLDEARNYRNRLKQHTNIADKHLRIIAPPAQTSDQVAFSRSPSSAQPEHRTITKPATPLAVSRSITGNENVITRNHSPPAYGSSLATVKTVMNSFSSKLLPDWHVYGSNTLRSDVYNNKGNIAATPYRFSDAHTYDELNLNVDRIFSPFHRITGQISGLLYNDSQYRSQYPGFVLERVNLRQENGEFIIPYRTEAGDFFAFQSYRTIQRSLKGGRIEFQPQLGGSDFRHSIELFTGAASPAWDNFQYKDDFSSGGSWLVQHPLAGTLSANIVFNNKQANGLAQPSLQQFVSSLAWEKRGSMLGQKLVVEAEAGRFIGDHPLVIFGRPNKQRQGNGFFAQVSGTSDFLPQLSYRFRGEAYEQDYLPNGASIQSDRNAQEGYITWRDLSGLAFTARLQHYHAAWQTNNPTDTITYGGNISGLIPVFGGITGSVDAFGSDVEDRNLTTNTMAKVVNINLSKPITPELAIRGGFYYANNHNKNNFLGLNITRQYSAGADYRFKIGEFSGTLSPGFIARRIDQQGVRWWDINPTVNANLLYGSHQLSLALSKLDQSSLVANNGVDTMTAGLNYRYTQAKYTFGLDANWYDRQPDLKTTIWTNAWRVGAYITYNFDKPVVKLAMARQETVRDVSPVPSSIDRMLVDIAQITPGMEKAAALSLIADSGLGKASDQAGYLIWYAQIFRDISANQRLVLEMAGSRLNRSAIIFDIGIQNDVAGIRTMFERIRRQLLAVYGQPDDFFDQGDFGPNMGMELAAGRFIRVMEWKRDGGTLRFGIPRRLDNRVRMELQFSRNFPILKDTLWSLEQVQ